LFVSVLVALLFFSVRRGEVIDINEDKKEEKRREERRMIRGVARRVVGRAGSRSVQKRGYFFGDRMDRLSLHVLYASIVKSEPITLALKQYLSPTLSEKVSEGKDFMHVGLETNLGDPESILIQFALKDEVDPSDGIIVRTHPIHDLLASALIFELNGGKVPATKADASKILNEIQFRPHQTPSKALPTEEELKILETEDEEQLELLAEEESAIYDTYVARFDFRGHFKLREPTFVAMASPGLSILPPKFGNHNVTMRPSQAFTQRNM
jgi:hypothetical protein